jgi:hypothetical protein
VTSRSGKIKKRFSRTKPAKALETAADSQQTKPAKKPFSLSRKKSEQALPTIVIPQIEANVEPANTQVLETYPLLAPFAYASIVKDMDRGSIQYVVQEPKLSPSDQANLKRLKEILNQVITMKPSDLQSKEAAGKYLVAKSKEIFNDYDFKIDEATQDKLLYCIVRDNLGFGKIDSLMHDQLIEDLSCDGVNIPIFVWHRKSESIPTNIRFETEEELDSFACGSLICAEATYPSLNHYWMPVYRMAAESTLLTVKRLLAKDQLSQ